MKPGGSGDAIDQLFSARITHITPWLHQPLVSLGLVRPPLKKLKNAFYRGEMQVLNPIIESPNIGIETSNKHHY